MNRHLSFSVGSVAVGLLIWGSVLAQEKRPATTRAALISELTGSASVRTPARETTRAARFDAMAAGDVIELGPESRAVIVLAGGQRFELGAGARATIEIDRLTSPSGPITQLPSLAPLPRVAALDASGPKGPPASIRLRGPRISGLAPSGAVSLASRTRLRFTPLHNASKYGVEVEDFAGRRVFSVETTAPEVTVPDGTLEPGASYQWTVRTLDLFGATARGASQFTTLSAEDTRAREALRRSLEGERDAGALALLANVDRHLGLYQDALDGFREALSKAPDDLAIAAAVRDLEQLVAGSSQ